MVIFAILSLIAGVFCGQMLFTKELIEFFGTIADFALYLLMFAVGISIGGNRQVFSKIKEYHFKIFILPIAITTASILAGFVCGWITGYPANVSVPISSAMGWYSLAGIMLTDIAGAEIGTVAFLSSLMRELSSFIMIPFLAKNFNFYTAIAPAGATSEDTCLPMLIKYTNEEVVVMAVFNGVICSALVPILIRMFFNIL